MQPFKWPARQMSHRPWFTQSTFAAYMAGRTDARPNGCALWRGQVNGSGYGTVCIPAVATDNGKRALLLAHKLSYFVAQGVWVPPSEFVCHHCDTPACVAPGHLYRGNASTNQADRGRRNRGGYPQTKPWLYKANAQQRAEIKALYTAWNCADRRRSSPSSQPNLRAISRQFAVSQQTVIAIAEGRRKTSFRYRRVRDVYDQIVKTLDAGVYRRHPRQFEEQHSVAAIARKFGLSVAVVEKIVGAR